MKLQISTLLPSFTLARLGSAGIVMNPASSSVTSVEHTFYGFPDNDPPGAATAYNCGGRNFIAGGKGTHDSPLSMASAPGEFNLCEVIYVPYLKKYVRLEDTCAQCIDDWKSGKGHIDMWTGSSTQNGGQQQIECENALTPDKAQTIIRDPDPNLEVDAAALYDPGTGACGTSHTYGARESSHRFEVQGFEL
ncbi:hypothetical protein A1O1_03743 [Capronia coronata CBS 617.96]|uniref:Uncharacterized protein n=1 Tax=Capronia coronata CBS 617.96 TaxID=1182541 RepID=W9YLS9_9EURO|nr:uncharacterized protein A1O1_03743 [Capronia coronata CBS 617.96]EXJ90640.1 hypothetical protein A1O1_03743 [Capronia coronata CBS 617.96]